MEDKHLIRDIFYLSVGSVAIAAQKGEELIDKLVKHNKLTIAEGEKIVYDLRQKSEQTKVEFEKKRHELINLLKDKLEMSKDEINEFFDKIMAKPEKAKVELKNKIDDLAKQIANKTKLTIAQGRQIIEDFIDDILALKRSVEAHSQRIVDELQLKAKKMKSYGLEFMHEIEEKSKEVRDETVERTQKAMQKLKDRLLMDAHDEMEHLKERLDKLENKVFL